MRLSLRRLPIRLKLTLLSAAVMALVITITGSFLYFYLKRDLDRSIHQALVARTDALATLARRDPLELAAGRMPIPRSERFAQILTPQGRVVVATRPAAAAPLLAPQELSRASRGSLLVDQDEKTRFLARPLNAAGRRYVVVAGASLDDREEVLETLAGALLIGGPLLLLLAAGIAYTVAAAALRPVEAMRLRAATIPAAEPGARLPLPETDDEVHRLGETLNLMLDRLERAVARERQFVADASHELRTPVAITKTELELALEGSHSAGELRAAIRSAVEEANRLAQLTEDLLVIAQSDQGRLPMRLAESDVAELLGQVAARFEPRTRESQRRLIVDAPHHVRVTVDPLQVEQALGNLVDNALRYGSGTVRLAALPTNGHVELHIMDRGAGFAAELLEQGAAFERFRRGDTRGGMREDGGAGLGLAIVRAIADAHGGQAGVGNLPYGGADAWISLPLAGDSPPP